MALLQGVVVATAAWTRAPAPCNPELHVQAAGGPGGLQADPGFFKQPVNLTLLPQDSGVESPAALDGSPFGLYFSPSSSGSNKWTISINGGGWCYDEVDCLCRSNTQLGSSEKVPKSSSCSCLNTNDAGDDWDEDCNCIRLPYLDGASFSGYRAEPWPVPGSNKSLYFRGIKNLDAAIDFAFAHGMDKASEFVLSGGSAGGLSTFLHSDRVAARLETEAPSCKKIRAAPIVGYFLDHDNFAHTTGFPGGPNSPQWSQPGTGANYTMWMKYVYSMQNMTFGADGALIEACRAKYPESPWLCFMSPHMATTLKTPFFMFNSKYDAWQLGNIFQSPWTTKSEQEGVLQYGRDFMTQLAPVYTGGVIKNGGMITSCICHGCPWGNIVIDGKPTQEWFWAWMMGKTTGPESMHIDPRLPNGNGTLVGPSFSECRGFPIM